MSAPALLALPKQLAQRALSAPRPLAPRAAGAAGAAGLPCISFS